MSLGPFHIQKEADAATVITLVTQLSRLGERIYIGEAIEADDADYPELNGQVWWRLHNSHDDAQRHVESGMASGTYKAGKLIGMAMDGDWHNQEQVIQRRHGIAMMAKDIGKELNGYG